VKYVYTQYCLRSEVASVHLDILQMYAIMSGRVLKFHFKPTVLNSISSWFRDIGL